MDTKNTKRKPQFLISSCLAGNRVRYDGEDQSLGDPFDALRERYDLITICPEVGIGMSVPRPPMHLRLYSDGYHAVEVEKPELDFTQTLKGYADKILQDYPDLQGCILKQKSPSCGTGRSKLFDQQGSLTGQDGWGVFAARLKALKSELIFVSEDNIEELLN